MFFNHYYRERNSLYLPHLYQPAKRQLKTKGYSGTGRLLTYTKPVPTYTSKKASVWLVEGVRK